MCSLANQRTRKPGALGPRAPVIQHHDIYLHLLGTLFCNQGQLGAAIRRLDRTLRQLPRRALRCFKALRQASPLLRPRIDVSVSGGALSDKKVNDNTLRCSFCAGYPAQPGCFARHYRHATAETLTRPIVRDLMPTRSTAALDPDASGNGVLCPQRTCLTVSSGLKTNFSSGAP